MPQFLAVFSRVPHPININKKLSRCTAGSKGETVHGWCTWQEEKRHCGGVLMTLCSQLTLLYAHWVWGGWDRAESLASFLESWCVQ